MSVERFCLRATCGQAAGDPDVTCEPVPVYTSEFPRVHCTHVSPLKPRAPAFRDNRPLSATIALDNVAMSNEKVGNIKGILVQDVLVLAGTSGLRELQKYLCSVSFYRVTVLYLAIFSYIYLHALACWKSIVIEKFLIIFYYGLWGLNSREKDIKKTIDNTCI